MFSVGVMEAAQDALGELTGEPVSEIVKSKVRVALGLAVPDSVGAGVSEGGLQRVEGALQGPFWSFTCCGRA